MIKIYFKHFHQGNQFAGIEECTLDIPRYIRYATRARAIDDTGGIVAEDWAFCSEKDNPSRKKGRAIAEGRILKTLKK